MAWVGTDGFKNGGNILSIKRVRLKPIVKSSATTMKAGSRPGNDVVSAGTEIRASDYPQKGNPMITLLAVLETNFNEVCSPSMLFHSATMVSER